MGPVALLTVCRCRARFLFLLVGLREFADPLGEFGAQSLNQIRIFIRDIVAFTWILGEVIEFRLISSTERKMKFPVSFPHGGVAAGGAGFPIKRFGPGS